MDIVQAAIDLHEEGKYEEAYAYAEQFDRYQQDMFFKATGVTTAEDELKSRILVGAYKIEAEKNPDKRKKLMRHYDTLTNQLDALVSGREEAM